MCLQTQTCQQPSQPFKLLPILLDLTLLLDDLHTQPLDNLHLKSFEYQWIDNFFQTIQLPTFTIFILDEILFDNRQDNSFLTDIYDQFKQLMVVVFK